MAATFDGPIVSNCTGHYFNLLLRQERPSPFLQSGANIHAVGLVQQTKTLSGDGLLSSP
jgi:hypothetical protein